MNKFHSGPPFDTNGDQGNSDENGIPNENQRDIESRIQKAFRILDLNLIEKEIVYQKGLYTTIFNKIEIWHSLGIDYFDSFIQWTTNFNSYLTQFLYHFRYGYEIQKNHPDYEYRWTHQLIPSSESFDLPKRRYKVSKNLNWNRWYTYLQKFVKEQKECPLEYPREKPESITPVSYDIFKKWSVDDQNKLCDVKTSTRDVFVEEEYKLWGLLLSVTSGRMELFIEIFFKNMVRLQDNIKVDPKDYQKIFQSEMKNINRKIAKLNKFWQSGYRGEGKKDNKLILELILLELKKSEILIINKKRTYGMLVREKQNLEVSMLRYFETGKDLVDLFDSEIHQFYQQVRSEIEIQLNDSRYQYKLKSNQEFFSDYFQDYKQLDWGKWEDHLETWELFSSSNPLPDEDESLSFKDLMTYLENLSVEYQLLRLEANYSTLKFLISQEYYLRVDIATFPEDETSIFLDSLRENLGIMQKNLDNVVNKKNVLVKKKKKKKDKS